MSSSSESLKVRVLRGATPAPAPALVDLDRLTGAGRRAVDPAVVEEAQARGYADGFVAGRADGHHAGREEALAEGLRADAARAEAVAAALAALAHAADELAARQAVALAEVEDALVAGALELAGAIVGRELATAAAPGRDALARALRLAEGRDPAVARLHPLDVETVGDLSELAPGREVVVVADAAVERGGCLLEAGDARVDAQLGPALARAREVLAR